MWAAETSQQSLGARRAAVVTTAWVLVTVIAVGLVCYGFGPLFQEREQRVLMTQYTAVIYDASQYVPTPGAPPPAASLPPVPGTPVGILEIGALHLQQVVLEGVAPSQTEDGPGHVPGTAGLGDPGNSVVVARRAAFGGPFAKLGSLRHGAEILVTTAQGQSVYRVSQVVTTTLYPGTEVPAPSVGIGAGGLTLPVSSATSTGELQVGSSVALDVLFGSTSDNRLTLVTSASDLPWNSSKAVVVVAEMVGPPFAPTVQASRNDTFTGATGAPGAAPAFVLVLLGYLATVVATSVAHRRYSAPAAWLLTTPPLVALAVLLAQIGSQLLPAWL